LTAPIYGLYFLHGAAVPGIFRAARSKV
jgi:hypothetical protein